MFDRLSYFFSFFLSGFGLLALSFLDSTVFFFTPLANDLVIIILSARNPDRFWLYALIAVLGSMAGAAFTFWMGRMVGEAGLERFVSSRRLERAKRKVKAKGAFAVGFLALVPPPFPLTPLVLAAGALGVSFHRFIVTAAVMRVVRFGAEAFLARAYGTSIIGLLESPLFKALVTFLIVLTVGGTAYAIYRAAKWRAPGEAPSTKPMH